MIGDTFEFHCPTKIYFRKNGLSTIGEIILDDFSFRRVFILIGGRSFKENGYLKTVTDSLERKKISYSIFEGIKSNPDIEDVMNALEECRRFSPDLVLSCGGGSVLDSGKLLSHLYYYSGNPLDFFKKNIRPLHSLPHGTVITIFGSGSEMSDSCVISDRKTGFKGGFNHVSNYPLFSLVDPVLTYTVPEYHLACGAVDMFSHSFERFFSPSTEIEPSDSLALSVMRDIKELSSSLFQKDIDSYPSRRAMMILSSLSHDGFTSYGKRKNFLVHKAEHKLSGKYPSLVHGQGIALLLTRYLELNKDYLKDKIIRMGKEVFLLSDPDIEKAISALSSYVNELPLYHSFSELPFVVEIEDILKAEKYLRIVQ